MNKFLIWWALSKAFDFFPKILVRYHFAYRHVIDPFSRIVNMNKGSIYFLLSTDIVWII